MDLSIGFVSILIWLIALVNGSLGLVVLFGNKNRVSRAFFNLLVWVSVWLIAQGLFYAANFEFAQYVSKSLYYWGGVLAAAFFYFVLVFPEGEKQKKWIIWSLILSQIFLAILYIFTNSIVYGAFSVAGLSRWGWHFGPLSLLFDFFFYLFWGGGIAILFKKFLQTKKGEPKHLQLKYMVIAMIIAITSPSFMNILLPRFGIFSLNWIGAVSVLNFVIVIAYSIIKYNQMDVKAVAAEVLVLVMVIVLFANIFTSATL
ncbi:MAG: histidine kinase N-terminal 7TM domain-containing protein, partial [bacterium]